MWKAKVCIQLELSSQMLNKFQREQASLMTSICSLLLWWKGSLALEFSRKVLIFLRFNFYMIVWKTSHLNQQSFLYSEKVEKYYLNGNCNDQSFHISSNMFQTYLPTQPSAAPISSTFITCQLIIYISIFILNKEITLMDCIVLDMPYI